MRLLIDFYAFNVCVGPTCICTDCVTCHGLAENVVVGW